MIHAGIARTLMAGAFLAALVAAGHADPTETQADKTTIRSGDHPGFGRIVIDTTQASGYRLDQANDHVILNFDSNIVFGPAPPQPRNVVSIGTSGQTINLTLKHGAVVHTMRIAGRVVLDILDPPDGSTSLPKGHLAETTPSSQPIPSPAPMKPPLVTASPEPAGRTGPSNSSAAPEQPAATAKHTPVEVQPLPPPAVQPARDQIFEAAQQTPPGRDVMPEDDGPVGLLARRVKLPKEMDGTAFLVPFGSATGAAAFREGQATYIIFDQRRPVDMAALRDDPVFGTASVQLLPNGTLLRVPLPPTKSIALTQFPRGWRVAAVTAAARLQPVAVSETAGHLTLAAEEPGQVVNLTDPDTGAILLVGTQHRSGQGVATPRRSTEFNLRPTAQGVVVEALSDSLLLKQVATGFTLNGGSAGLLLSPPTAMTDVLMDAAHLTRRLDFPTVQPGELVRRETKQIADAAATPPMARGPKNHLAAETLMALGMGAEAQSLLHVAADEDPREVTSPDTEALTAIAALLAGRVAEADALNDPRLDGTDEITLWRAVRQAMQDQGSPSAAAQFAATAPLAFRYPQPIQDHILPLIIETMIQGGELQPAQRLLKQRPNDPTLAYARALARQAEGNTDQALTMLDALANGHDQFDRARAAIRAVELRLAARQLNKTQAADALDKLLYAWRGDARELALRERVADLRGQTGAWRTALSVLKQAEADFPEQVPAIHEHLRDMFAAMISDQGTQQIPPLDFVAMVDENIDLIPASGDDETIERSLADRLLALDLPARAKPVLEKLMHSAASTTTKARFGLTLARLDVHEANDPAALADLDASASPSDAPGLPPDLLQPRTILRAEAVARRGDPAGAAAMLASVNTSNAAQTRAQILEAAADWTGAAQAWADCVRLSIPAAGALDETQARTIIRLATATARAGDDAGLAALRATYAGRIGAGPLAGMFRLLTAEPVRSMADIGRSQQEMSLAASLPAGLKALQGATTAR